MTKLSRRTLIHLSCTGWICSAQKDPPWRARVVNDGEKGQPLIIRGRVLRSNGGPPAPGTTIMVYQTDDAGIYSTQSGSPMKTARLRGQFTTSANGEYEIVTILPGPYPGGGAPRHIHVNLIEPGKEPYEICEFFFSGDPLLSGKEKGYVLQPRKDAQGVLVAVQDFAIAK